MRLVRNNRTARISIGLTPEGKERLRDLADDLDIPMASLVRMLCNEALKARGYKVVGGALRRAA